MSRPLRLQFDGAIYHVTVRGNGGQAIFQNDDDRRLLCSRIERSVERHGVRILLFCLMGNHFHLLVETPKGNLTAFMHGLLTAYTVSYNLRHGRHGHLTQGRFGARLVSGDSYLLKLSRYVHLNPVRVEPWTSAPLEERVAHLRTYAWSSYLDYIGRHDRRPWMHYDSMLALTTDESGYQQFVETGVAQDDEELRRAMTLSPHSIGPDSFCEWVRERHASLSQGRHPDDIAFRRATEKRVEPETVLAGVAEMAGSDVTGLMARRRGETWKGLAALLLTKHAGLTNREVASLLGWRSGSGVTYPIARAQGALRDNPRLAARVARLTKTWG